MARITGQQGYNAELAELIIEMAASRNSAACRSIFHREIHRVFEPEFFPSLLLQLAAMGEMDENSQFVASNIFVAVVCELREYLGGLDPKSMGPMAICLDILVRPIAAALEPSIGSVLGVEIAKGFVRHREQIRGSLDKVCSQMDRLAAAAKDRSQGKRQIFALMKDVAKNWRETAQSVRLMDQALSLCGIEDQGALRSSLREARLQFDNPQDLETSLLWLDQALQEHGDELTSNKVRRLMAIAVLDGVSQSIEQRVSRLSVEDTEHIIANLLDEQDSHQVGKNGDGLDAVRPPEIAPPQGSESVGPWGAVCRLNRFTKAARKALMQSEDEARQLRYDRIYTENLLLGLINDDSNVAAMVLRARGIQTDKIRSAIEFVVGRGGEKATDNDILVGPRAMMVIDLAKEEARRLGHDYIGTGHLLAGLLLEDEGIAAGVLESLELTLEEVRDSLATLYDPTEV